MEATAPTKDALEVLFPDIDFNERTYKVGMRVTLTIDFVVNEIDLNSEYCYSILDVDDLTDGISIDDGKLWVTDDFIERTQKWE